MREIIHIAFSDAFDIFLGWCVIMWAYTFSYTLAKARLENKFYSLDTPVRDNVIAFSLCLVVSAAVAFGIFFLRTHWTTVEKDDYTYCLTAFFILFFPSVAGVFWGFYKDKFKNQD